jgi:hypothetical protein
VAAAGPLAPATGGQQPAADGADATAQNSSNASMGAEVSAFMQASASDANASVDEGMFAAEWNQSNASADALVDRRANALESRIAALQNQKERLLAKQDQLNEVAYTARMSALAARIDALQNAIDSTSARAERAGVNTTRLNELRSNASELAGPEVAAVARNLSVGVRGPPNGTPGNGPGGAGPPEGTAGNNSTTGGAAAGSNDSTDEPAVDNPGNDTVQGPSANDSNGSVMAGNSSGDGNATDGGSGADGDGGTGAGGDGGTRAGGDGGDESSVLTGDDVVELFVDEPRTAGRQ